MYSPISSFPLDTAVSVRVFATEVVICTGLGFVSCGTMVVSLNNR